MIVRSGHYCCVEQSGFGRGIAVSVMLCVIAFFTVIEGAPARAESMMDALKAAYENNPALLAERARQRASDEAVPQALAGFRPKVSMSGSIGVEKTRRSYPITHTELDQSTFGLSLSQPIFSGFRAINSTRRARAEVFAGQETLFDVEQSTLLSVVAAYMDVRRARRTLSLRQDNVSFLNQEVRVTAARAREGELTITDTEQAKSRLYQGQALLEEARADLATSEANYEALVGQRPGGLRPAPPVRHLVPRSLSEAVTAGENENPLVTAAMFRKKAAEHDVQVQRGELLPTVSLDASYLRSIDPETTIGREDQGLLELRFNMPLYNAGTTFSKIREARAVASQRGHEVDDVRRGVKASVVSAWQRRLAAHKRMRVTHIAVTSAEAALKGIKLEAAVGERSVFDVLDAQRDVVDAQVRQVDAERDFIVSTFTLIAAMGRLSAEGLELDTPYYDPDANYKRVRYSPGWTARIEKD